MKKIYVKIVNPGKLCYKYPIFERLRTDPNNPWFLQDQIDFYKNANVPVAYFALPGQKKMHHYAILDGESKDTADALNREFYRERDKAERAEAKRILHEAESYDVKVENGYDIPEEGSDPYEIIAYLDVLNALTREYQALSEEKKRFCDTIKKGMTQRAAAEEMGMPRTTYLDHLDTILKDLRRKLDK